MPQNFLACDREQELLLPPSLREWLAEDHFAWFVIDVVGELDLAAFFAAYRADGHGRAAHDPAMMVALIVYAYAIGERSSRRIERRCREDVAFRVITANQAPDHATLARFRVRHERALGELFGQVLRMCADAGLMRVGVVAVDGTKVHANASERATRDYVQIAREILEQAAGSHLPRPRRAPSFVYAPSVAGFRLETLAPDDDRQLSACAPAGRTLRVRSGCRRLQLRGDRGVGWLRTVGSSLRRSSAGPRSSSIGCP